ncbi:DUF1349 domain-containing protein [Vagococcus sp. BWB3-3]|uniref:DUF1349 domain-containing protein n=1 Tax=Vagococcus allomyrinae TaxID=2794353 RepID=A0A940SUM0_9ENTE|nr:DUF1349 domain-containing protein [Vagococcus allomyrinae]MBP1044457.1 DUF1349 domain-containing protein [Vagococcus allomyrinae]
MNEFNWQNESELEMLTETSLKMRALPQTDFFVNPETSQVTNSAAFYFKEITGDFVLQAKVTPEFQGIYDAGCLFFMKDDTHWGKLCFENTDIGTQSVVSVVTNGTSDDANGVDILGGTIHLQMIRKGDLFGFHYSHNGQDYLMNRYFKLACGPTLKVGLVAQSPLGKGTSILFEEISLRELTAQNVRLGEV